MLKKFIKFIPLLILLASPPALLCQTENKPLVLQEMSWFDVQEYLKHSDMVIIPLGSTEQHGPHLPLGSDFYEAFGTSKLVSAKTGVLVAPVVLAGYSYYHSGFPGTLSLKPETLEQVIFETAEMLIKYGFRKFMFLNYHGGNNIIQTQVIHRINHETEAVAVAIGVGSPIRPESDTGFFDWHGGLSETSNLLYLKPELVRMERAQQPVITFTPEMKKLQALVEEYPELEVVWSSLFGVPAKTGKGGASHELSSNGIWTFSDVKSATAELGKTLLDEHVDAAVRFINAWRMVDKD